jgi:hypothetical protein
MELRSLLQKQILILVAVTVAVAPGSGRAASAAEPLAWKFEEGASNRYRINQSMTTKMDMGQNKIQSKVDQIIDMSWTVLEVKPNGSATLEQKVDRMRMTIDAGEAKVEVDTASEEAPQNQAAMIAPLLKAITAGAFRVTMSPRGEISDVVVPEEMVDALKNAPGAAMMGDLASAEGFKRVVSQAAFAFPDKLEPNTQWTQKTEMNLPNVGKQTTEITYKYVGPRENEDENQTLEAFEPSLKISYAGGESAIKVNKQESSGEVLFNREAGRLERSQLKQSMSVTFTSNSQQVDQTLEQQIDMKWLPEDAE